MGDQIVVLVVDDSRVARIMAAHAVGLAMPGARIIEAVDGQEAIDRMNECPASIILMDVNMPVMDGLEASACIRQSHPEARIILCTANIQDAIRAKAKELSVGFIAKPVDPARLTEALSIGAKP
jgi:two-component system chemotaxis response regulator CheY